MHTSIADLRAQGAFASRDPVIREVTWHPAGEPVSFSVHVRQLGIGELETLLRAGGTDSKRSQGAAYLAATVRLGEHGEQALTYEDAYALAPTLARALIAAADSVNGGRRA